MFDFNTNHIAEENLLRLEEKFLELEKMLERGLKVQRQLEEAVAKVTAAPEITRDERVQSLADLADQVISVNTRVRLLRRKVDHLDLTITTLREFVEA